MPAGSSETATARLKTRPIQGNEGLSSQPRRGHFVPKFRKGTGQEPPQISFAIKKVRGGGKVHQDKGRGATSPVRHIRTFGERNHPTPFSEQTTCAIPPRSKGAFDTRLAFCRVFGTREAHVEESFESALLLLNLGPGHKSECVGPRLPPDNG